MATPHPERELDRARKLAKAGLPQLVIACGKEAFFRGEAMDLLLAAVPKDAELVTIEGLDVADTRGGGVEDELEDAEEAAAPVVANAGAVPELQVLRGGGLFAKRAFLVVRRADKWVKRHGTALLAFLPKVAAGSGLVLELQSLDRRTKLAKALDAAGEFLEFRELYERPFGRDDGEIAGELVQWVVQRASAMGVPLSAEAALLMTAQVGKAPSELAAEL
ncbi:MAG: polymerase delta subunit, partial [Planctomycetota bacterium]